MLQYLITHVQTIWVRLQRQWLMKTWKTRTSTMPCSSSSKSGRVSFSSFNHSYYMASSASGQDDPNPALWLATRAGKMEPSCPLGTTRCTPQAKLPRKPYNKFFIDQVCSVKVAGYWPRSFFASLWTSTSSRSINTQKRTWPISSYLDLTLGQ